MISIYIEYLNDMLKSTMFACIPLNPDDLID